MQLSSPLDIYTLEITPNRSRDIDRFNRTAGAPVGSYWCASFVYTVADESCKKVGLQNPLFTDGERSEAAQIR